MTAQGVSAGDMEAERYASSGLPDVARHKPQATPRRRHSNTETLRMVTLGIQSHSRPIGSEVAKANSGHEESAKSLGAARV